MVQQWVHVAGERSCEEVKITARDHSEFTSPLPHPGEHLREEYLPDYRLTPGALAKAMGLKDRTRIERFGS